MPEKLEFTGERFTPECEREIWYEHMHRYAFAARYCVGKRVLDAACGEGYGSAMLAGKADEVIAVDISRQAVEHARQRYSKSGQLHFEVADCTRLPFEDQRFDIVVSFETLEHLSGQEAMIAEFRRVLQPGGLLILSSPDKAEYSDKRGYSNEHHVRELYREELEQLISKEFPASRLLSQKLMFHSVIWDGGDISRVELLTAADQGEVFEGRTVHAPMYFIALCAASEEHLPDTGGSISLFDDSDETVYDHYQHEIRKNMAAGGILAEKDAELKALKDKLSARIVPWWRRLFRSD